MLSPPLGAPPVGRLLLCLALVHLSLGAAVRKPSLEQAFQELNRWLVTNVKSDDQEANRLLATQKLREYGLFSRNSDGLRAPLQMLLTLADSQRCNHNVLQSLLTIADITNMFSRHLIRVEWLVKGAMQRLFDDCNQLVAKKLAPLARQNFDNWAPLFKLLKPRIGLKCRACFDTETDLLHHLVAERRPNWQSRPNEQLVQDALQLAMEDASNRRILIQRPDDATSDTDSNLRMVDRNFPDFRHLFLRYLVEPCAQFHNYYGLLFREFEALKASRDMGQQQEIEFLLNNYPQDFRDNHLYYYKTCKKVLHLSADEQLVRSMFELYVK